MPLRHRCEYAADLPRSLPGSSCPPPREFPAQPATGAHRFQPRSTRFELASHKGDVKRRFLTYSSPSRSPNPSHLAVLARPGFVRAAYRPHRRHPDQTALSSTVLLRQDQRRRSLTSTRTTAPHGTPTTPGTPQERFC